MVPVEALEAGQWSILRRSRSGIFGPAHRGATNKPTPRDREGTTPAGLDFTLARGKIPSQRGALESVPGS